MASEIKANSGLKKLIHIGAIAAVMTVTLGVAVVVSGRPAPDSPVQHSTAPVRSAPQSALPAIEQPELLHDAPTVELQQAEPLVSHTHTVRMMVTAYCPCPKCCGANASGITASGKLVTENGGRFVAADSKLPFGTKLIIPGYSSSAVEVLDRGGAIRGNHIDVFFRTHEEALQWGRRMMEVTIVD